MIDKEWDVIIVGCGPGGSGAAFSCASQGLKTLAIDKNQEIGVFKRCGEGLSKSSLERIGLEPDKKWINQEILGATCYAPNGKFVRMDYPEGEGWVIERKIFDKELARKAVRAGAKILSKTECLGLIKENGKIKGIKIKIGGSDEVLDLNAKIIIACDGVESKLARETGINTTLKLIDICSCVQFEMAGIDIDPKRIELYFGNEIAPGGYVWIFPKGEDIANVGIGIRKPMAKFTALEYLKKFVNSKSGLKKGSIIEVNGGGVPVGGLLKNMVTDNFMLVGDAAHQVNPIHGGGIAEAYLAGKLAGEVVAKAFKLNDFSVKVLDEYNKKWWELRGNKLEKLVKLRVVLENLSDEDLNWLAEYLKGEDLISLARASGFKRLATLLMKKPKLIKFAKLLF